VSHPGEDLAVYALDALDEIERRQVDDHLAGCPECRLELDGHYEVLAALGPDEAPPPRVWEGVMAAIRAPAPAPPPPPAPMPPLAAPPRHTAAPPPARSLAPPDGSMAPLLRPAPRPPLPPSGPEVPVAPEAPVARVVPLRRPWMLAAAGLVAAAVAGGVLGFALGRSGDDGSNIGNLADQAGQDPDGLLATLDDGAGDPVARVVADDDGAYVVLEGLQDLPEGRAYQLWSLTGPEPVSLGMLGRDGSNTVAFRLPPTITKLAISVAPTSGDVTPNGSFSASGDVERSEA
jgi:hypothetical protein